MKKVGDLFAELGFKADASDSVKRAFVENLVRAANESSRSAGSKKPPLSVPPQQELQAQTTPQPVAAKKSRRTDSSRRAPESNEQLSFDFGSDSMSSLISQVTESKSQRRSS